MRVPPIQNVDPIGRERTSTFDNITTDLLDRFSKIFFSKNVLSLSFTFRNNNDPGSIVPEIFTKKFHRPLKKRFSIRNKTFAALSHLYLTMTRYNLETQPDLVEVFENRLRITRVIWRLDFVFFVCFLIDPYAEHLVWDVTKLLDPSESVSYRSIKLWVHRKPKLGTFI